jgi:hypothetical protein
MSDPALWGDVVAAIRSADGVSLVELPNGDIQVARGDEIRVLERQSTVSRNQLKSIRRWCGLNQADFFPPGPPPK